MPGRSRFALWINRGTMRRIRIEVASPQRWIAAAVLIGAGISGCLDDTPLAPRDASMQIGISAQLVAAHGHSVEIAVSYARTADSREIFRREFEIDTGVTAIPVTLDLQTCLADPERVGSRDGVCLLSILLVLRDSARVVIDSGSVGEIEGTPGGSATTTPITLGVRAARFEVVSGQDQIGVAGLPLILPVELRAVDSAGAALANRLVTIEAASGGGSPIATTVRTDENGIARMGFRLGTEPGANTFRVASGSVATMTVSATGVRVQSRLASGMTFTCALDAAGAARCCGSNGTGALGVPAIATDTTIAVTIPGAPAFTAIAASHGNHPLVGAVCALTAAGAAYCWGTNDQGQLGVEVTDQCQFTPCTKRPILVAGGQSFLSIAVGGGASQPGGRACGITAAGDLYCWGSNADGQLGTGNTAATTTPTRAAASFRFVQVSLGDRFTCGLTSNAEAFCWGDNTVGQLGDGSGISSLVPVRVASSERFTAVSAGQDGACALTANGEARCWGGGTGTPGQFSLSPAPVPGDHRFTDISVGLFHVCALTATGETWCWGRGMLGQGLEYSVQGNPVRARAPTAHRELSTGWHTCARNAAAEVYCWGGNWYGQLGIGNRENNPVPVRANLSGSAPGVPTTIASNTSLESSASRGSLTSTGGLDRWTPQVRVTDDNGVAIAGVPVSLSVISGGGTVAFATVATNAAGLASASWRLGTSTGSQVLTATAVGLAGSPVTFTATAIAPGPAVGVGWRGGATAWVGTSLLQLPYVNVRDAAGYVVADVPVAFTRTGRGGTVTPALPTTIPTDADGVAALSSWTVDTIAGADTVRMSVAGIAGSFMYVLNRLADGPWRLVFIDQPQGVAAGAVLAPVRVQSRDRYGNPTTSSVPASLQLLGGTATLGGTTTVDPQSGIWTFSNLTVSAAGTYQLRVTMNTLTATSAAFTVTP